MPIRERLPNNWWGWAKVAVNAAGAGLAGFAAAGPIGAAIAVLANVAALFQHTPANTALTPMQLQARAAEQAAKQEAP